MPIQKNKVILWWNMRLSGIIILIIISKKPNRKVSHSFWMKEMIRTGKYTPNLIDFNEIMRAKKESIALICAAINKLYTFFCDCSKDSAFISKSIAYQSVNSVDSTTSICVCSKNLYWATTVSIARRNKTKLIYSSTYYTRFTYICNIFPSFWIRKIYLKLILKFISE